MLDGPDLFIDFDVPALQLLGFEHAPENPARLEALIDKHRQLDSELMIQPSLAADCTLTESFTTVGHGYDDLCSRNDPSTSLNQPPSLKTGTKRIVHSFFVRLERSQNRIYSRLAISICRVDGWCEHGISLCKCESLLGQ